MRDLYGVGFVGATGPQGAEGVAGADGADGADAAVPAKYSFHYNFDRKPFYDDGLVSFGWDAPGNDIECYMLTAPANSGGLRSSCFIHGTTQGTHISITEPNYMYDLFPAGVPSGEVAEIWVSAYNDTTYPMYKLLVHHTGTTINIIVEKNNHQVAV